MSKTSPAVALALVLMFPMTDACALWSDSLKAFVSETVTRDSNLFRISQSANPNTLIGSSERGDTIRDTALGLDLDLPVSLQRFQGSVSLNDYRYTRFKNLDFTAHDARGAWLWQVSDVLSGRIGVADNKSLASFINYDPTQPRAFDEVTTRQGFANAGLMLTPRWKLLAGVEDLKQRHSNVGRRDNDLDLATGEVGLNYVTPAGNQIGLSLRDQDGRYPHRQFFAGSLFDNAYKQRSAGVVVDWTPSAKSHLNARIDRLRREYQQLGQRDFEGTTWQLAYDWRPTVKTTVSAVAMRDISADEDIGTSFVLQKGVALRPSIELREKLKVSGSLEWSRREYLGNAAFALGVPNHTDILRLGSATLTYQALRSLQVLLTAQREERTSNIAFGDYTDNVVNLAVRFEF